MASISVIVPSAARQIMAELWRRLTTANTSADFSEAQADLCKSLTHTSPVVHSAASGFVVDLVTERRLMTVDDGTEVLLNAAIAAASAQHDQALQCVVRAIGALAVHRVLHHSPSATPSSGGSGVAGHACGAMAATKDDRAWQPFLKIITAAPDSSPTVVRELMEAIRGAAESSRNGDHARALLASSQHVLLKLLAGRGATADAVLRHLLEVVTSARAHKGAIRDESGPLRFGHDVAFFLAAALPCLSGPAATEAYRVADTAKAIMDLGERGEAPDNELITTLLHRLVGVLVEDDARSWPQSALESAFSTLLHAVRTPCRVDGWVLGCLAWLVHVIPSEHSVHLLDIINTALDAATPPARCHLAVMLFPVAKLADDLERSGHGHAKQAAAVVQTLNRLASAVQSHETARSAIAHTQPRLLGGPTACHMEFWSSVIAESGTLPLLVQGQEHERDSASAVDTTDAVNDASITSEGSQRDHGTTWLLGAVLTAFIDSVSADSVDVTKNKLRDVLAAFVAHAAVSPPDAIGAVATLAHLMRRPTLSSSLKLELLRAVPQLAAESNEAVRPVAELVLALASEADLVAVSIALMVQLWLAHDRSFPALQRLLCDRTIDRQRWPPDAHIARAVAIRAVCLSNPERRGLELVVGVADVLGASDVGFARQAERHRTVQSLTDAKADCVAMAVESLDALCTAGVVDATSVWSKIRPHVAQGAAAHPRVATALCRFVRHYGNAPADRDDDAAGAPLLIEDDTNFSGFRAAALGYLWHCIEAADADSVVRSAAVAALANFHTGAMLPPVPARNMNFDPTAQSNRVVTAAEFAPLGVERIDALMGESDPRVAASSADVAARAIRFEVSSLGRATRVAWKQGRPGVHTTSAASASASTVPKATAGADNVASERDERLALRLARVAETCKQSHRRKALMLCHLLLPSSSSAEPRNDGSAAADSGASDLAKLRDRLGRQMRGCGGWETHAVARVDIHAAWCSFVQIAVQEALVLSTPSAVRAAVTDECSACFSSCASTDPIAAANALMVVGALASTLPLHDGLLGWLESVHSDLLALLVVDDGLGDAVAKHSKATLFIPPPHGAPAEAASGAAIAVGLVVQAMQRFGGSAAAPTDIAARVLTEGVGVRGGPDSPRLYGCAVGLGMVAAAAAGTRMWPADSGRVLEAATALRDAAYSGDGQEGGGSTIGGGPCGRLGAAVGLGLLTHSFMLAPDGSEMSKFWSDPVLNDVHTTSESLSTDETSVVDEPAAVHLWLLARYFLLHHHDRGKNNAHRWLLDILPDAATLQEGFFAAFKSSRFRTASAAAFTAGAVAHRAEDLEKLCGVLTRAAAEGNADAKQRENAVMALCVVVGHADNRGGRGEEACVRSAAVMMQTSLEANSHPSLTAFIALSLGGAAKRRADGSRGDGSAVAGAAGGGAEPLTLEYLPKGSGLRVVFETLADKSVPLPSRGAALNALALAFRTRGQALDGVLPPVDWTAALPPPPSVGGNAVASSTPHDLLAQHSDDGASGGDHDRNRFVIASLRFALEHHAGSPSLQRYVSMFVSIDVFPMLDVALRITLARALPAITQLVAAVDLQRLLDDCMVPALMAKGEAEGSLATAVVTGLSGCLDRSVPSADAAFGAALSAFAALRSVPASLLTMSRVDDIVGLLSRVPSGLLTPMIEPIVATQGTTEGCGNPTTAAVVLGLALQKCVHIRFAVAALRQLLAVAATLSSHAEGSRSVLLLCVSVVGSKKVDNATVADVLLDVWSSFEQSESCGHAGGVAALATSLALLVGHDHMHAELVRRWMTGVLAAEQGGVGPSSGTPVGIGSSDHAIAWLPALLPRAAAEWVRRLTPDVTSHVVGVVVRAAPSSLDLNLRRALLSALAPTSSASARNIRPELFAR